ncbi:MAG TPA: hypothetical protein VKU90_12415 [Caulobacteraceae bacterium]|nr:hypothetical protein [Caulobacteraceae bacterium]
MNEFMRSGGTVVAAVVAAGLAGCQPSSGAASSAAPASSAAALASAAAASAAPAASAPSFQVVVTLSPKAAASVAQSGVSVDVMVSFYGDPTDTKLEDQYQGQYPLATDEEVKMTGAGTATIAIPAVDPAKVASMRSGAMYQVTVVTGNHTTQNNTLDCTDPLDQPLAQAAGKTIAITCKLIGES